MRKVLRLHLSQAAHDRHECWCQRHVVRWWYPGPTPTTPRHRHPDIKTHAYAHLTRRAKLALMWRIIKNNVSP